MPDAEAIAVVLEPFPALDPFRVRPRLSNHDRLELVNVLEPPDEAVGTTCGAVGLPLPIEYEGAVVIGALTIEELALHLELSFLSVLMLTSRLT